MHRIHSLLSTLLLAFLTCLCSAGCTGSKPEPPAQVASREPVAPVQQPEPAESPVHATSPAPADTAKQTVLLFGAASVENALDEVLQTFQTKHPEVVVRTNYGATSTLAQQVMQGAEADLFLSANEKWADSLHTHQPLVRRQDLISNELVVVVLKDSRLKLAQPEDLLSADLQRLALADTQSVPAGLYARQALEHLGLWDKLEARVAVGSDVRQALAFVETGAAQAGIVYRTDALVSDKVTVALALDPKLSDPVRYPWLLLHHGGKRPAAVVVYEFVLSAEAAEIFRRHGFSLLEAMPESAAGR